MEVCNCSLALGKKINTVGFQNTYTCFCKTQTKVSKYESVSTEGYRLRFGVGDERTTTLGFEIQIHVYAKHKPSF